MQGLHYLYEQVEGGKERFVFSCPNCDCVLRAGRNLVPASEAIRSIGWHCKGCGHPLEGSIECRLAPIPDEWSDIIVTPAPRAPRPEGLFRPAASIPHFALGFPQLDFLLRPFLKEGRLVLFRGASSSALAELAAFRAQLPIESGGLDSSVVYIDGGNRSDPYLFSSFARSRGIKPADAMRRVTSCRVFTLYQLGAIVSEHLVRAAEDYGTKLVIISDLLGTFNEPELEEREARRVLGAIDEGIQSVKKHALVIATLASPNRHDDTIISWADATLHLSDTKGGVRAELSERWNASSNEVTFRIERVFGGIGTGVRR